jgi:hypothetical protein
MNEINAPLSDDWLQMLGKARIQALVSKVVAHERHGRSGHVETTDVESIERLRRFAGIRLHDDELVPTRA